MSENYFGYYKYNELSSDSILSLTTEEEIFNLVIEGDINTSDCYYSPFREDPTPGCDFEEYEGMLWFRDRGSGEQKKVFNCFELISKVHGFNYPEALEFINSELGLQLGLSSKNFSKEKLSKPKKVRVIKPRQKTNIIFGAKDYDYFDGRFWNPYEITKDQLLSDGVFSVRWFQFWSNKKGELITMTAMEKAYIFTDFKEHKKIYFPDSTTQRFLTDCTKDDIGNINNIDEYGKDLIITKSYKDCRVVTNQGYNSVWFHNEGAIPSFEQLKELCFMYDNIYVIYDNDSAGKTASKILCEILLDFNKNVCNIAVPEIGKVDDCGEYIKYNQTEFKTWLHKQIK